MPITLFDFTCPDGHTFTANAKLRARCPNCGKTSRRNFLTSTPTKPSGVQTHLESSTTISTKAVPKKISDPGLKPVMTTKKGEPLDSEIKSLKEVKSPISNKTSPRIIRQGSMPRPNVQKKQPVKTTPVTKTTSPTRRVRVGTGNHPIVARKPTGSKERKVTEQLANANSNEPFWHKVKRKYFR